MIAIIAILASLLLPALSRAKAKATELGIEWRDAVSLAAKHPGIVDPSTLPKKLPLDSKKELQCTTCHNAHESTRPKFLRMDNPYGATCITCHQPPGWTQSSHAISPATWNGIGVNPWPTGAGNNVASPFEVDVVGPCDHPIGVSSVGDSGVVLAEHINISVRALWRINCHSGPRLRPLEQQGRDSRRDREAPVGMLGDVGRDRPSPGFDVEIVHARGRV